MNDQALLVALSRQSSTMSPTGHTLSRLFRHIPTKLLQELQLLEALHLTSLIMRVHDI